MTLSPAYPSTRDWLGRLPPAYYYDTGATLDLDFLGATRLPSYVTFTRANATATRFNSAGQIVMCAANEPRFTHDLLTRAPKGLMIKGARTNLLVNSVLAGGTTPTGWSVGLGDGTTAVAASIYGAGDGATALLHTVDAARQYFNQDVACVTGTTYCYSLFVEANPDGNALKQMAYVGNGTATVTLVSFYVNGVAGTADSVPAAGSTISMTFTVAANGTARIRYGLGVFSNATGSVTTSRTQVEAGAMRSSFIPTTTGTVARAADLAVITGTEATSRLSSTTGTLFVEASFSGAAGSVGGERVVIGIDQTAAASTMRHTINADGGGVATLIVDTSTQQNQSIGSAVAADTVFRVAQGYEANNTNGCKDGTLGTNDTSCTMPAGMDEFTIGSRGSSVHLFGCIRRIIYFSTRLSDAALAFVTNQTKVSGRALSSGCFNLTPGTLPPAFFPGNMI